MANLFVGTNYYITDTYQDDDSYYVNTHITNDEGEFLENKAYAFDKDSLISNLAVTPFGAVTEIFLTSGDCRMTDGTYTNITQESTTGSGTGLTLTITADSAGPYTATITDGGQNYAPGDEIVIAYGAVSANTARAQPTYVISNVNSYAENFFPTGLGETDLISNALPFVNSLISSGTE
jgi:hypothetical protein